MYIFVLASENAAKFIQSHFRRLVKYQNYTRIKNAVSFLQAVIRVWVMVKGTSAATKFNSVKIQEQSYGIKLQNSIQSRYENNYTFPSNSCFLNFLIFQSSSAFFIFTGGTELSKSFYRYLIDRHAFIKLRYSVIIIQRAIRYWISRKHQIDVAIMIQKNIRGHAARSVYVQQSSATIIQASYRSWILRKSFLNQKQAAIKIQSHYRRHTLRKSFLNKKQATTKIQGYYSGLVIKKNFLNQKQAATKVQSYYRGFLSRKSFLSQKQAATKIQSQYRGWLSRNSFLKKKQAVMKLQKLYQSMICLRNSKQSKLEIKAVIVIQSYTRRWIARRVACRCKCFIVLIQVRSFYICIRML